jgi:hypothetical protein
MNSVKIEHPVEQALVARTLVIGAKHASKSVERYVQWLLAGFAAGFVYLLGQPVFKIPDLRTIVYLFAASVVLGLGQRYIAMIVETGVRTFQEVEKLNEAGVAFDPARFFILYIDSTPASTRFAAAWSAKRLLSGDLSAGARGLMYFVMAQSTLAFVCTLLLLWAFYLATLGA